MGGVVFDIETVGQDFEMLDGLSQEYFLRFADTPQKQQDVRQSLSFYPLTAEIVSLAMMEIETGQGAVYFQDRSGCCEKFKQEGIHFIPCGERQILKHFWSQIRRYDFFVTFSGRIFDCPFIMIRSAVHHLRTTKNLMPYRYSHAEHVDLADQLSFYDAMRRKFNLHMWCQTFGVESPKSESMSGHHVKEMFLNGRFVDIAQYCLNDCLATKSLYRVWSDFLMF